MITIILFCISCLSRSLGPWPWLCSTSFIPSLLSVLLPLLDMVTSTHISPTDCLTSVSCSTPYNRTNRWIAFLAPELCTNISRLIEQEREWRMRAQERLEWSSPSHAAWFRHSLRCLTAMPLSLSSSQLLHSRYGSALCVIEYTLKTRLGMPKQSKWPWICWQDSWTSGFVEKWWKGSNFWKRKRPKEVLFAVCHKSFMD